MLLSIVIPCFNEAKNLPALMAGYWNVAQTRTDVEIILVDNGSTDDTKAILELESKGYPPSLFQCVRVEPNQGYGHGILTGLAKSRGNFLGWSHADLQCPPADVFRVWAAMQSKVHPELCFGKGVRTLRETDGEGLSRIQERLASLILGSSLREINAQPKVFPRSLYDSFKNPPKNYQLDIYAYYKAILLGLEIVTVDVGFFKRAHGRSSWANSFRTRLKHMAESLLYLFRLRFFRSRI